MTPDGKKPTPYKRYYDFFTWLVSQTAFSFTTAPFVVLTYDNSMLVWGRVYFYVIIGVMACSLFLLTPGKQWLQKQVKAHTRPALQRQDSHDSMKGDTYLGLPNDPGKEWDEMVDEITEEVKKRRGSKPWGLEGKDLRQVVEEKMKSTTDKNEL